MAGSVVSLVTERLAVLLIEEGKLLSGVSDDVDDLITELNRMLCFLKDADAKVRTGDHRVRNWVAEIRDLAFKAESVVEMFAVQVASKGGPGFKRVVQRFSTIFDEAKARHRVATEIRSIKFKITNLTQSLQTYGVRSISEGESSNPTQSWLRQSYPHVAEEHFVGMKEDMDKVLSCLLNEGKHTKVVSLWGMGGVGKTTLAKKMYNHIEVHQHFEAFAWVSIGQQCQPKQVLQDVLRELLPAKSREEIVTMGDRELVQQLYKVQQDRKCLVVLDDIWTLEAWNILIPAFPIKDAAGHSKLLLTTRTKRVAEQGYLHHLCCLSEEDGWLLLQKKAFPVADNSSDIEIDYEMEELGRDMVKKCGCLPLAISVLGGILKDKPTTREWDMVNCDINLYLRRGEGIDGEKGAVQEVLSLSFDDLPYRLRPCFLYFGHFLEDVEVRAEHLCLLWIAEGMVSSEDQEEGETLMEVAERYLSELAQRSMVQVTLIGESFWWSTTKKLVSCHIHDLMLNLCLSKGREEDFLKVLDFRSHSSSERNIQLNSTHSRANTKNRRLSIYVEVDSGDSHVHATQSPEPTRHITTLLFHGPTFLLWENLEWPLDMSNLARFAFLRVLEISNTHFGERKFPHGIEKLIYLRYLRFDGCASLEIPRSIRNLRHLQVLDLYTVYESSYIPNVVWKMKRLRHLYLPYEFHTEAGKKLQLGGLSELETLKNFNTSLCDVNDLDKLTNLRNLDANIEGNLEDVKKVIGYLNVNSHRIQKSCVYIRCTDFCSNEDLSLLGNVFRSCRLEYLHIDGKISKLPEYVANSYAMRLTTISLWRSGLAADPFATFEKLPNLQTLSLVHEAYTGKRMVCSSLGFPQLRRLNIRYLSNLEMWGMGEGAMPKLSSLVIMACNNLELLPDQMQTITSLRLLQIGTMPESFNKRFQVVHGEEGEDLHKVRQATIVFFDGEYYDS